MFSLSEQNKICYKQSKFVKRILTRLFQLVGDDTTYEVRLGGSQSGHQVVKLFLKVRQMLKPVFCEVESKHYGMIDNNLTLIMAIALNFDFFYLRSKDGFKF